MSDGHSKYEADLLHKFYYDAVFHAYVETYTQVHAGYIVKDNYVTLHTLKLVDKLLEAWGTLP